ncbi:MAG: hypothetical protein AAGD38_06780, partial [Acidobacteriota bacterium]
IEHGLARLAQGDEIVCEDGNLVVGQSSRRRNLALSTAVDEKGYGPSDDFERDYGPSLERIGYKEDQDPPFSWFQQALLKSLSDRDLLSTLLDHAESLLGKQADTQNRKIVRAYYAVGMIFAGDTPGSPFGEFAVASDIQRLADELRFSLSPVYEPRSSFRELRVRPDIAARPEVRAFRSRRGLAPGEQRADDRGEGPQPVVEPAQSNPGG